jgi:hypothetical protein
MKDLILKILREETGQIDEIGVSNHFLDQKTKRFNNANELNVIVNNDLHHIIGKFYIRDHDRDFIENKIDELINHIVPNDVTVCVPLIRFYPSVDNVTVIGNDFNERESNRQKLKNSSTISLVSPDNRFITGNYLVLFIAKGNLRTIHLVDSIVPFELFKRMDRNTPGAKLVSIRKIRDFDEKIKLAKTLKEIKKQYHDIKNPNVVNAPEPQPEPQPDQTAIDKELKRQHYLKTLNKNKR